MLVCLYLKLVVVEEMGDDGSGYFSYHHAHHLYPTLNTEKTVELLVVLMRMMMMTMLDNKCALVHLKTSGFLLHLHIMFYENGHVTCKKILIILQNN